MYIINSAYGLPKSSAAGNNLSVKRWWPTITHDLPKRRRIHNTPYATLTPLGKSKYSRYSTLSICTLLTRHNSLNTFQPLPRSRSSLSLSKSSSTHAPMVCAWLVSCTTAPDHFTYIQRCKSSAFRCSNWQQWLRSIVLFPPIPYVCFGAPVTFLCDVLLIHNSYLVEDIVSLRVHAWHIVKTVLHRVIYRPLACQTYLFYGVCSLAESL